MSQFCTFFVADSLFGIDVQRVQEVIREQPITKVPLARIEIRGLMNLRGQIVPAIDLRRRLGLPEKRDERESINVVVRVADGAVSLLADEIGDVLDTDESAFESAPETLHGAARELVAGAYKLSTQLLLTLDLDRLLDVKAYENNVS